MTIVSTPITTAYHATTATRGKRKPRNQGKIALITTDCRITTLNTQSPENRGNVVIVGKHLEKPMDSTFPITTPPVVMRGNRGNRAREPATATLRSPP